MNRSAGLAKAVDDVQRERARLFAMLMRGEIESYTLRRDGNRVVFESSEKVDRLVIKIDDH